MTTDLEKSHLLTSAIALAERGSGTGGPPKAEVGALLLAYYRYVAIEDVVDRSAEELYGALVSHYRAAEPVGHQLDERVHDLLAARAVGVDEDLQIGGRQTEVRLTWGRARRGGRRLVCADQPGEPRRN